MPTLAKYHKMRDFSRTAEPRGDANAAGRRAKQGFSYVIQKHAARRLHYDFRLELDGVLLSWAVPKGPSANPGVKRLAVETEPHPLEYGGFEGIIPKGEYGGGTVMVWDRGSWTPEGDPRAAYAKGHLVFQLDGDKLQGAWHLVRTRGTGGRSQGTKDGASWLLFKSSDEFADSKKSDSALVDERPNSALSGRTLEQIAAEAGDGEEDDRAPSSSRRRTRSRAKPATAASTPAQQSPKRPAKKRRTPVARELPEGARRGKLPKTPSLELATLVDSAPEGDDWLHEIKFDGYRVLVRLEHGTVTLLTRKGLDWTQRMPTLARAFAQLNVESTLIDGEFVALDARGISNFQTLQNSLSAEDDTSLVYYAFDLLHLNGIDLSGAALLDRKKWLQDVLESTPRETKNVIRLSEHVLGGGPVFFEKACELGLEGIVSKRASAPYKNGRGHDWLKVKCVARQEFVIVGYTDPGGSRSHLGALVLGVRGEQPGRTNLVYAGRVGTGFSQRSLKELLERLAPLRMKEPPLSNPPRGADARGVHWVKPELVAEVAFTGFTDEGLLRHPTFQGLREDKSSKEVVRETPAPKPKSARAAAKASPASKAFSTKSKASGRPSADPYPLSNPDRILYPEQGITKRELLDYYALVAERMLPHVANRPLTLVRCPSGRGKCFFQKHPGQGTPDGMRSISIREKEGKSPYSVIDDATGLFGLVQLGCLEIHTWGSRADDFEHPDLLVFDLDPDPAVEFKKVIEAAKRLRELFESAKLESFVKTTGGKGLHVCVPIEPDLDWTQAKDFSMRVAEALARESPDRYVATQSKAKRRGKIFIDYLRNGRGATFIAPYSTRARENAPVAVPLEWDELTPRSKPDQFTLRNLKERLLRLKRDPFERMLTVRQALRPDRAP